MKTNWALARLIIKDIARASGLSFEHADVLSRAEAKQVLAWGRGVPEIAKAYGKRSDKNYEALEVYRGVVEYFAHEHPADGAGAPEAWPAREGPVSADVASLRPAEAEALLTWAKIQPEFREDYLDAGRPLHKECVRQVQELTEIISRAAETTPTRATPQVTTEAFDRIKQLQADPAYLDRRHPGHAAKVAEMQAAYEVAYPPARVSPEQRLRGFQEHPALADPLHPDHRATVEAAHAVAGEIIRLGSREGPRGAAAAAASKASSKQHIKDLHAHPAYLDKSHPDHRATVNAMQAAYQDAFPEGGPRE